MTPDSPSPESPDGHANPGIPSKSSVGRPQEDSTRLTVSADTESGLPPKKAIWAALATRAAAGLAIFGAATAIFQLLDLSGLSWVLLSCVAGAGSMLWTSQRTRIARLGRLGAIVLVGLPLLAGVIATQTAIGDVELIPPSPGVQPVSPDSTVVLSRKAYTCESVANLVSRCTVQGQLVFDNYKGNLGRYINSQQLGFLDTETITTKAFIGITACVLQMMDKNVDDFTGYILENDPVTARKAEISAGSARTGLLPAWSAASTILCPGA